MLQKSLGVIMALAAAATIAQERTVPARLLPVPTDVSPQMQAIASRCNTVRVHRKLKDAGVEAELNVFEAMSHANYFVDDTAPETHQAFGDIAKFFDRYLAK
jgi:acetyl esterase/lipase